MSDREESPADNGADVAPDDAAASDGDDDAASAKRSHSRSRTRSHSRSPKRHHSKTSSSHHHHRRHHRSRSRSRSPRHHRSRSPGGRRRHFGSREDPEPTRCLGIFGMSLYTSERDLKDIFGQYGPIESVQIVHDHPTGRSRGFGFVYFENTEDAIEAKDRVNGTDIDGQRVRIDFSITKRAHTPTPGQYMGRSHDRRRSNGFRSGGGGGRPSYRSDYGGGGYDRGYDHRGSGDYRGRSPYDGYYDDHRRRSSRNSYDRDYN